MQAIDDRAQNGIDGALFHDTCLIGGDWVSARDGRSLPVLNPSNGHRIAVVPMMSSEETAAAITCAKHAQERWREIPGQVRGQVLTRWADLLLKNQEDLAKILTSEQGKPLAEARGEITYAASFLSWFGEEARRISGDVLSSPKAGQRLFVLKQPIGVCAAITPWNFPAAMVTRKAGPALAAGCSMLLKPAEATPLTAFALADLALQAGVPPGVFQVITGDPAEIGKILCESPIVRKLSFTGSTQVGRTLMAQCAPTIKKLSLELGGNAPLIVFDDADLDRAVAGIVTAKFRNSGQTCVCPNRIYVQAKIYEELTSRLVQAVTHFRVGDGFDTQTSHGPLINDAALRKVELHVNQAVAMGATVEAGGNRHPLGGTYFQPTVLSNVDARMLITQEETFGPVAPLIRFTSESEVIRQANDSEFGLAAYLFSRDHTRIWRVAEALEAGMVGVNTGAISNEVGPFGGIKQSGLGREGSKYGMDEYLELKYICLED